MSILEAIRQKLPRHATTHESIHMIKNSDFQYGRALVHWKQTIFTNIPIPADELVLMIGGHTLEVPSKGLGVEVDRFDTLGANYNWQKRQLEFNKSDLSDPDFPVILLEEYEHSQHFTRITRALTHIRPSLGIDHFPKIINGLPNEIKTYILAQKEGLKRKIYLTPQRDSKDTINAASLAHEFVVKKSKLDKLLAWSNGHIEHVTNYIPSLGSAERVYFEIEYLKLLLHARLPEHLDLWSWGIPLDRSKLPTNLIDVKTKISHRLSYLKTGRYASNTKSDCLTSWVPEDYRSTQLYQYLFGK